MATNTLNAFLESPDEENDMSKLGEMFRIPETPDDCNEPFIENLIKQQEEINRFRDICNPGISYGLYHYW